MANKAIVILLLSIMTSQSQPAESTVLPPPLPVLPVPSSSQLRWQHREIILFYHFGVNTFTNSEWGTGHESPSVFDPAGLDATQWMAAADAVGASLVILTAKHHDGFCLWPSRYTRQSVAFSPWKSGRGDLVQDFVTAARSRGIDAGLYLSPWDRHDHRYGLDVPYNEYYAGQLHELLANYGAISEIWFDGAKGPNTTKMSYRFDGWFATAKQLQGSINIFSDAGPDLRWVGDEGGAAGTTCWSPIDRTRLRIGDPTLTSYLNVGDPGGADWVPPECDISIRPGWFWHGDERPKSLKELLDVYYSSVGRNCVLLLNVPPNTTGLVSDSDVGRLREFRRAIDTIFGSDVARGSIARASSQRGGRLGGFAAASIVDGIQETYWAPAESGRKHWIELRGLNKTAEFNVIRIQEMIGLGQRIKRHVVYVDGKRVVKDGTTVGHKRLYRLDQPVRAKRRVRILVLESRGLPLVSAVGLHFDPFLNSKI